MRSESTEVGTPWGRGRVLRRRRDQARKAQQRRTLLEALETRCLMATLPPPTLVGQFNASQTDRSDESAPSIAIDQTNPNRLFAAWVRNSTPDDAGVRPWDNIPIFVEGAYSVDGGQTWNTVRLSNAVRDPNIPGTTFPFWYTRVTEPTVAFDRSGNVFVLKTYSNDDGSSGSIVLSRYSFTAGAPVAVFTDRPVYTWTPGFDRAIYPTLAVDDTVGSQLVGVNRLNQPLDPVFGPNGDLFVINDATNEILRYDGANGDFLGVFVAPGSGGMADPQSLVFAPNGNLLVADGARVLRFNGATGAPLGVLVTAGSGGLQAASAMTIGPDGNLYVADRLGSAVRRYDATTGGSLGNFVATGASPLNQPSALLFRGNRLLVASFATNAVLRYDSATGAYIDAFVAPGSGGLVQPDGLTVDATGNLLVASLATNQVLRYDGATGAFLGVFVPAGSGGLNGPSGVVNGPNGSLYVSSYGSNQVLRYDASTGGFIEAFTQAETQVTGQFVDPESGRTQTNLYSGNVYVAWGAINVNFGSNPGGFNPNRVALVASSDGGNSFSGQIFVDDNGNFTTARHTRPRLVVSQGTAQTPGGAVRVAGGQVSVVWDDFGTGASASTPFDVLRTDRVSAGATAAFGPTASIVIPDAIAPAGGGDHIPTPINIPINVDIQDLRFNQISDLDVYLSIDHGAVQELQIELIAPDGRSVTLVRNQTNAAGTQNQAIGISGAGLGVLNGVPVGTIFNDEAVRNIVDFTNAPPARGANAPFTGNFRPEGAGGFGGTLSTFYGMTRREANGQWTLRITDFRNGNVGVLRQAQLRFQSDVVESFDTVAANTIVRGQAGGAYALGTGIHALGIGPGATIASDNTLGSFSPYQGRLYMTYVGRYNAQFNPADNTEIFLVTSDDGGVSWSPAVQVNDDNADTDGFSNGDQLRPDGRPQFQPSIAVDPVTGTVAMSWLDGRFDAARVRMATMLATSIDGGETFSSQGGDDPSGRTIAFANQNGQSIVDAITGEVIVNGPLADNQSTANPIRETVFGFGDEQSLVAFGGRLYPAWTSNRNAGLNNDVRSNIVVAPSTISAGPRIISSTMGPVSQAGDLLNPLTPSGPALTRFEVEFDRPVDPASFRPNDIAVYYRDTQPGNPTFQIVSVLDVVPVDTQLGLDGQVVGSTRFEVQLPSRSGVGTYSYVIGPSINDRIRTLQAQITPGATFNFAASADPTQVNLRIPVTGTGGTGTANDITVSRINVTTIPVGEVVADVNVRVNLTHTFNRDLTLTLIAPDGTRVILANRRGGGGDNFTNTVFDDEAALPISLGVSPFTGTFRPDAPLSVLDGRNPLGQWRLEINDQDAGDIGTLLDWSLQIQSGVLTGQSTVGNRMDQDGNARPGELAVTGIGIGDVYAAPRPTTRGQGFQALANQFFPGPYDPNTLPLIVTGPRVIGSAVPGTAASPDNLALDRPVSTVDVRFDRPMIGRDVFTGTDVLRITGPVGEVIRPRVYNASIVGQAIFDAPSGGAVLAPLTIDDDGTFRIGDLNVRLNVAHRRVSDLSVRLIAPDGTAIQLVGTGVAGANFTNTVLDDESPTPLAAGAAPYAGVFRPFESLTALDGKELRGTWYLEVKDNVPGGSPGGAPGTLQGWGLEVTPQAVVNPVFRSPQTNLAIPNGGFIVSDLNLTGAAFAGFTIADLALQLDVDHPRPSDLSVSLIAPSGTVVPLFANLGGALSRNFTNTILSENSVVRVGIDQAPSTSFTGIYRPQNANALAQFNGQALQGLWRLQISDSGGAASTVGALRSWSLIAQPTSTSATATDFRVIFPTQVQSGTYAMTLDPSILSQSGAALDTSQNAGLDLLRGTATGGETTSVRYASTDVPLPVADGRTTVSTLTVNEAFLIADLNVTLDITHRYDPDLTVVLVAPDGTRVTLFSGVGVVGNPATRRNFTNTTLDDEATTPIQNAAPPFFGTFNPQEPLGLFKNRNASGTWTLEITDAAGNIDATNRLNSWSLSFRKPVSSSGLGEAVADRAAIGFRIFTMDPRNPLSSQTWTPVGPAATSDSLGTTRNGYGGRVSTIAIDPSDPTGNTVYAGAASGGVWKTTNFLTRDPQGPTWVPLTDFGPTFGLNVGSLAIFPRNNDPNQSIIVAATGEGSGSFGWGSTTNNGAPGSTTRGVGFLRSMDGGATWTLLDSTDNTLPFNTPTGQGERDHRFAANGGTTAFKVIVDPTLTRDGQVVIYAAMSGPAGGLWRSLNTGDTWEKMSNDGIHGTSATDVTLDLFSKASDRRDANGLPAGNVDQIYAAFAGRGVYFSPNRGQTLNRMDGTIGLAQIRDGDVAGTPGITTNTAPNPNNAASVKIVLSKPDPVPFTDTNSTARNILYQGWLYAAVETSAGIDGLYLTKDHGQTWTQVQIRTHLRAGSAESTRNTARPSSSTGDPAYNIVSGPGLPLSVMVDPNDPEVVYLGGSSIGQESGLLRVDTTLMHDSHALIGLNHGFNDGGTTGLNSNGNAAVTTKDLPNRGLPGMYLPPQYLFVDRTQYVNLIQDPRQPFVVGSNVYLANVASFKNDGSNARWIPIDEVLQSKASDFVPATDVHQIVPMRDPITGNSRLLFATNQGIFTGVFERNGSIDRGTSNYEPPLYSRIGNMQIGQLYRGSVQPTTTNLQGQLHAALFYGMTQSNGFPQSDPSIIGNPGATTGTGTPAPVPSNGQISWTGSLPSEFFGPNELVGSDVWNDPQGNGTVYQFVDPSFGGQNIEFFLVNGIARTRGLLQTTGVQDPQWNAGIYGGLIPVGRFAVNPLSGDQLAIGSNAGRIFATTNQGRQWNVIANPQDLDGSYVPTLAYGAPEETAPGVPGNLGNYIYAGTIAGNIFLTRTGGGTPNGGGNAWINASSGLDGSTVVSIQPTPDRGSRAVYAATLQGVYYTPDALNTPWRRINGPVNGQGNPIAGNLFATQQNAFGNAALADQKTTFLTSLVVDWRYAIPDDFTNPNSPLHPVVYAGGNAGVYRSLDNGETWELFPAIADGAVADGGYLPSVAVTDLDLALGRIDIGTGRPIVDASSPNVLMASTFGRGAFAIRLAPQIFGQSLQFAAGSDSGTSATDRVTNVKNPTIEGLSAISNFGSTITVELIDLSNPANPVVVGTGTTNELGEFSIQITGNLADGDKVIGVQAIDQAGTRGNMALFRFTLDSVAPTAPGRPDLLAISDSGRFDDDDVTNATSPVFRVSSTESATTVVTLYRNGRPVGTGNGPGVSGIMPQITDPGPVTPDGTYSYTAQQVDLAGNTSPASDVLAVTIDTTPPPQPAVPTLIDDSGTVGDGVTNVAQPLLRGTSEPGALVELRDLAGALLGSDLVDSTGIYEIRPGQPLTDGKYTLRVVSTDIAGNTSLPSSDFTLTIQTQVPGNVAPTLALVRADDTGNPDDRITNNVQPRFTGTATPGLRVELFDTANPGVILGTAIVAADGSYIVRPNSPLVNLGETRTFVLQMRVRDVAGNTRPSNTLQITIDTGVPGAGPTLSLRPQDDTGPSNTDGVTVRRNPVIIGTTIPGSRVVIVDLATGRTEASTVAGPDGKFSTSLASNLTNGSITVDARVVDVAGNQGLAGPAFTITIVSIANDFDNDGKSDPATFQPTSGLWSIARSTAGPRFVSLGRSGDVPVSGDFNGDGKADPAVYRPSDGKWYVLFSSTGSPQTFRIQNLTTATGDMPVPADYDGDGLTDFALYRPSDGKWYVQLRSGAAGSTGVVWGGGSGDVPVPGDYNGDGKAEFAYYRPSTARWFVQGVTPSAGVVLGNPGSTDVPVPGDYDGDGKFDMAIYRPGARNGGQFWYRRTTDNKVVSVTMSTRNDIPVPDDYNGDGKVDPAVYRSATGQYQIRLPGGTTSTVTPGQANEIPVQAPLSVRMRVRTTTPTTSTARVASTTPPAAPAGTAAVSNLNMGGTAARLASPPAATTSSTSKPKAGQKGTTSTSAQQRYVILPVQLPSARNNSLDAARRTLERFRRSSGGPLRG